MFFKLQSNSIADASHQARHDQSGAVAVELAFSATAFFLFLIVTFEIGIVGWRAVTAQYIASKVVREAAFFAGDEGAAAPYRPNYNRVRNYARRMAADYGINFTAAEFRRYFDVCPLEYVADFDRPNAGQCQPTLPASRGFYPNGNFGNPESFIVVRLVIPSRIVLQTIPINVTGWAVARNEEFKPLTAPRPQ